MLNNFIKINQLIRVLFFLLTGLLGIFSAKAQTLGVVWTKNYENMAPTGLASSLTPQPLYHTATGHARYLLTGTLHSRQGFIAMLDETGNVLKQWDIDIPDYYNKYPKQNASERGGYELSFHSMYNTFYRNTTPDDILASIITSAVMKPDGSILAFGYVLRHRADSWSIGTPDYSPGSHAVCRLKTGVWKIRIDAAGNVVENTTARGAEAYKMLIYNNKILLPGLDINETGSIGILGKGVGMLHEYDLDGNFVAERCPADKDPNPVTGARKLPNGDIFLDGWLVPAFVIDGTSYLKKLAISATVVNSAATNVPLSGTGSVDNGFFINPQFSSISTSRKGATLAKIKSDGTLAYRVQNETTLRNKVYDNPLVLDPVNGKYVGTVNIGGVNKMYILTDNLTGFAIDESASYPNNTALQDVSLKDGFFSMANNLAGTKRAVTIAKLSACANFKLNVGVTERYLITGESLAAQTITHTGNQPGGTIAYSWTLKDVTTGGGAAIAELAADKSGSSNLLPAQSFTLLPGKVKGEAEYMITAIDTYMNNGVEQTCNQTYTIKIEVFTPPAAGSIFSDDVWFFGNNQGGDKTSRGIVFRGGVAHDYSGVSMVDSWENSLSVSTPACDGSFIFYAQHDKVFNSKHVMMDGGTFVGNNSNSDGLAACYIGNNKYMLFAVSDAEVAGVLNYYYIDMSENNGLGKMSPGGRIDINATRVNEAIELLPKAGTYDKYWLVYHDATNELLKVVAIDGSLSNPIGDIVCEISEPGSSTYYGMRSNTTFDRIAISVRDGGTVPIYKFNPASGEMSLLRTITERASVYGTAFSPNGKYLYAVPWNGAKMVNQYDVETGAFIAEDTCNVGTSYGGGMKLGPDGKIYISREHSNFMAVIKNPDLAFTEPGGGTTLDGFKLTKSAKGLEPSVGLTPPWISPPTSNQAPTANPDFITSYAKQVVTLSPLADDVDPDNDQELFLVNAELMNIADAVKGTVTFDENLKTVTFTPNPAYNFTDGETVYIRYQIRDNGLPVAMCDDNGVITVTLRYGKLNLTLTPAEVNEGDAINANVCLPDGMAAPIGGIPFTLTIQSSSDASTADFTGSLSGTIPAGQQCAQLTLSTILDKLVEGNETLVLKSETAVTGFAESESKTVTIKDMTSGSIIVEKVNPADDTSEPNTNGAFRIRFKEIDVVCTRAVEVTFTLKGSAENDVDYEKIEPLKVTIPALVHAVTIPVTVKNNYIVQGNRNVIITIIEVN